MAKYIKNYRVIAAEEQIISAAEDLIRLLDSVGSAHKDYHSTIRLLRTRVRHLHYIKSLQNEE